jgi:arginine decarboxylase
MLDKALSNSGGSLEVSSATEIPIVRELLSKEKIDKSAYVVCNGFKSPRYTQEICKLLDEGYNILPVLDTFNEIHAYEHAKAKRIYIGIRVATSGTESMRQRTSRTDLRYAELESFISARIRHNSRFRLKLLRFFVNTSIRNTGFFWTEFICFMHKYCELCKVCSDPDSVNLGDSLSMAYSFDSEYDYEGTSGQVIGTISKICSRNSVPVPQSSSDSTHTQSVKLV